MKKIIEKIKEYNKIILIGHIRPDGDCLGSLYGLKGIIEESFPNKKVIISNEPSEKILFLGVPSFVDKNEFIGSLVICLDCATKERLSDSRYRLGDYVIKIDHHINIDNYANYEYVDSSSPACSQIIGEFYNKFKKELKMNEFVANCLYTGILTDTGNFKYNRVTSKTFDIASILYDKGVNLEYINNNLFIENLNVLKLRSYILRKFKISKNGFAYIIINKKVKNKYKISYEEIANEVVTLSNIDIAPVWGIFIHEKDEIRVRLRSRSPRVDLIANKYGGGGHYMASGIVIKDKKEVNKIILDIDEMLKTFTK